MFATFYTTNFSKDFIKTWKRFNIENTATYIIEGSIKTSHKIISTPTSKDLFVDSNIFRIMPRLGRKQIQFLPQFGHIIKILSNTLITLAKISRLGFETWFRDETFMKNHQGRIM